MSKRKHGAISDRISDLPGHVIDNILCHLPLQDAVKTSTLSKTWKSKWRTIPEITIDDLDLPWKMQLVSCCFVNYILNQHINTIRKFSVYIGEIYDIVTLQSWICNLQKSSIQDLTLVTSRGKRINLPDNLYSCQLLKRLCLHHFTIKLPCSFTGFQSLMELELKRINLRNSTLQNIINICRLLEKLDLKELNYIGELIINAPNLKFFKVDGEFLSISFNTPRLEMLFINAYEQRGVSRTENSTRRFLIFNLPSSLEQLHLFREYQATSDLINSVVRGVRSHNQLKLLEVDGLSFASESDVSSLFVLIRRFSNLHKLMVSCDTYGYPERNSLSEFWEEQERLVCSCMSQLQNITIRNFVGYSFEMRFIQILLANSPVLKEIILAEGKRLRNKTMIELLSFPRASAEAKIKYIADRVRSPSSYISSSSETSISSDTSTSSDWSM